MEKLKLVMIGNGMAGCRTLEELLKHAPDLYDITVFGAEPHPNYNRIMLSPVLAGEMGVRDIILNPLEWYAENKINLHLGKKIEKIDRVNRTVIASDGTKAQYDRLLLATGSSPFILPVPGKDLPGVIGYRDIADTDMMIEAARLHKHAVVIGAGLLGLEAANGLLLRGMDVTVVHIADWIMERQLDKASADMLMQSLEQKGIKFRLNAATSELVQGESGRVCALRLKDGETIPADIVVMAAVVWWSMTPCKPTIRASTPLANAPNTAASPTAWWRRCSSRPRSAPIIWPCTASAVTPVPSPRPSSRSPASMCSPPANSWAVTVPRKSCCTILPAVCTRSWCSRTRS
jgi:NAD(P)H-nitrite reductase large subunit